MPVSFDNTEIAFRYRNDRELKMAHFLFTSMGSPFITRVGIKLAQWSIDLKLPVTGLIKSTLFNQFCGGETIEEVAQTAKVLGQYNVDVALDYGVEGQDEEEEFDRALPQFIKTIEYAATQNNIPFVPIKLTGFAHFALLEKMQSGTSLTDEEQAEWERVAYRIDQICGAASRCGNMILIDAEESWIQQPVDDLADKMMAKYNTERPVVFNTFQLYRHDRLDFLKSSYQKAEQGKYILGAKLVRGAYMEKERERAARLAYPSPIQASKENTDRDYNEAILFCLDQLQNLAVFIGTHNEASCMLAIQQMADKGIAANHAHVFFSQLYGMSDNITFNLANADYQVSKYLPYGPVADVIPYLMRRAQENTSVAGQTGRELGLIRKELKRRKLK